MAIEDAVVLARCLRDGSTLEAAFETYEAARRERVEKIVALGRRRGNGKTPGLLGRWVRDMMLRLMLRQQRGEDRDPMAWVFDHRIVWERT